MNSNALQKAREYEARCSRFIPDTARPAIHLSPLVGWMNDPNGFSYYQGKYHLFYQYNPYHTRWGPMHWGHAVSEDMLHWEYLPCAMAPDMPYDDGAGCFSGSAIELPDGRHLLMYTGVRTEHQEDGSRKDYQTQCLAIGDGLNYEKLECNPVLTSKDLPEGGSEVDFRDPKLWQEPDGTYHCILGNRSPDDSGWLLLYRSADAIHWEFETILDRCYNEFGKMWECPDYFTLDGKKVILTSPQDMDAVGLEFHNGNGTLCLIGEEDPETHTFVREQMQAIDYGLDFYATQTILTPDGRRVMAAWMQNWDACVTPGRDWRWFGQMAIPRELRIRDNKLIQCPIREIEQLRGRRVYYDLTLGEETSLRGVYGRVIDMTVTLTPDPSNPYELFRMKLARGGQHYTMVTYKPRTSVLRLDRSHCGFVRDIVHERKCLVRNQNGAIKLRVILDRFSVEVFVNDGEQVLSATIYTPDTANGISFEVTGQQVNMKVEKYSLLRSEND